MVAKDNSQDASHVYDVLILGAGPSGLAVASRLREQHPSALFTDDEHGRYHWIKKHSNQASIRKTRSDQVKTACPTNCGGYSTLVLDSSGNDWMARWNALFKIFNIEHLRSPMFFHPDPSDRDALLAYARDHGREDECVEIAGCVGKEVSKHKKKKRKIGTFSQPVRQIDERDRKDYFTPSTALFNDFCRACATRYHLHHSEMKQEIVQDIDYGSATDPLDDSKPLFTITSNDTSVYHARTVVLAIGGGAPIIPAPFPQKSLEQAATHAMEIGTAAIPPTHLVPDPETGTINILVIGGGLTSAQLVHRILQSQSQSKSKSKPAASRKLKVHLLLRSHLKLKPFDLALPYLGKFRNTPLAAFHSADTDTERLAQAREARDGGSITPTYHRLLKTHEEAGALEIYTNTTVASATYYPPAAHWTIATAPSRPALPKHFAYVYFATGTHTPFPQLPCLRTLQQKYPIQDLGGFPLLTEDLAWRKEVPLFVTGKYAMLRVGPGAGNLEGARVGAERCVWGLRDWLGGKAGEEEGRRDSGVEVEGNDAQRAKDGGREGRKGKDVERMQYQYAVGLGNRFEGFSLEDAEA